MKATTFHKRGKEKDAYDLYTLIKEYSDGLESIIAELRIHRRNKLVKEAIDAAAESFQSIDSMGPIAVADFLDSPPGNERDIVLRDAYEIMKYVLDGVRER